jgi:hypothetical protein
MAGIEVEGVAGNIKFNEEGDPIKTAAIIQIKDGEKQFVKFVAP